MRVLGEKLKVENENERSGGFLRVLEQVHHIYPSHTTGTLKVHSYMEEVRG